MGNCGIRRSNSMGSTVGGIRRSNSMSSCQVETPMSSCHTSVCSAFDGTQSGRSGEPGRSAKIDEAPPQEMPLYPSVQTSFADSVVSDNHAVQASQADNVIAGLDVGAGFFPVRS